MSDFEKTINDAVRAIRRECYLKGCDDTREQCAEQIAELKARIAELEAEVDALDQWVCVDLQHD